MNELHPKVKAAAVDRRPPAIGLFVNEPDLIEAMDEWIAAIAAAQREVDAERLESLIRAGPSITSRQKAYEQAVREGAAAIRKGEVWRRDEYAKRNKGGLDAR